jgi:hypothetical protein
MEVKRPFSQLDWLSTPEPVRAYIIHFERMIGQMQQRLELVEKRTKKLEARAKINSQNSSKPPSSDSPFNKQKKKTKKVKENTAAKKVTRAINSRCLILPILKMCFRKVATVANWLWIRTASSPFILISILNCPGSSWM